MVQNGQISEKGQNCQKWSKRSKMVQIGKMVKDGQTRSKMVKNGHYGKNGLKWRA